MRDALAGKELIGFAKLPEQGDRSAARSNSAKVSVTKDPRKFNLQRSSTTKVDIVKVPD